MKDDRLNSIPPLPRSIKQKIYQTSIKQKIVAICYAIIFGFFAFFGLVCFGAGETDVGVLLIFIACIMLLVVGLLAKRRWERALSYLLHARLSQLDISLPSNSEKTQSNARSQESGATKSKVVKRKMGKTLERRWRSKVSEGLRVKIPKDIADMYKVKKDDIVEWTFDGEGNIKIAVKEMVLREKKAKVEKVSE